MIGAMPPDLGHHDGYIGAFTRAQADGAIPNGTKIIKVEGEEEGGNPNGTLGTVLGSIDGMLVDPELCRKFNVRFMYFIEWDPTPKIAVSCADRKIARVQ